MLEIPSGLITFSRFRIEVCMEGLSYSALKWSLMMLPSTKRVPSVKPAVNLPLRKPPASGL